MKYIDAPPGSRMPTVELTRRNLTVLLAKLDDPASQRTIYKEGPEYPQGGFAVRAVENDGHYARYVEAARSALALPTVELTRRNIETLLAKLDGDESYKALVDADWRVVIAAVEDEAHYSDRPPGEMFMPSSGETI